MCVWGRFNFGLNDTFFVLPPFRHNRGWYFKETYFRVRRSSLLLHRSFPQAPRSTICLP